MIVCETCDEEVMDVDEYGVCPSCYQWELNQGWHQDDVPPDEEPEP